MREVWLSFVDISEDGGIDIGRDVRADGGCRSGHG